MEMQLSNVYAFPPVRQPPPEHEEERKVTVPGIILGLALINMGTMLVIADAYCGFARAALATWLPRQVSHGGPWRG
jgi:hypothetical protein